MSTKKQREILRQKRIEFDRAVEESRRAAEKPKKKAGRPKKKKESDAK